MQVPEERSRLNFFHGWQIPAAGFVFLFLTYGTRVYSFPVFFAEFLSDMGWTRTQTGAITSVSFAFYSVLVPILGNVIIPRVDIRRMLLYGCIIGGIGLILLSTISEPWQCYLYYGIVMTFGMALIGLLPISIIISNEFGGASTPLGIASAGIGVGGVVMPLVSQFLISTFGWRVAFICLGIMVIVIGCPISAAVRKKKARSLISPPQSSTAQTKREPLTGLQSGFNVRQVIKMSSFWFIMVASLVYFGAFMAVLTQLTAFAQDIVRLGPMAAASVVSLVCIFSIAGRLGFGKLGDMISKKYVLIVIMSLAVLSFIILLLAKNAIMLYISSSLLGLSLGITPLIPVIIGDYFGKGHFAGIYSFSEAAQTIGCTIGPILGCWMFDSTHTYSTVFTMCIVLAFSGVILACLLPRKSKAWGTDDSI